MHMHETKLEQKITHLKGVIWPSLGVVGFRIVVVNVISNAAELLIQVGARDQNNSYTEDVLLRDCGWVRCVSLEHKFVDPYGNGAYRHLV